MVPSAGRADPRSSQVERASLAEVRNPILGLRAFKRLAALHPDVLQVLCELLHEIHLEAAERAEHSWKTRKAPMAVYWRAVSVYAGHIRRALRRVQRAAPHQLDLIRDAA